MQHPKNTKLRFRIRKETAGAGKPQEKKGLLPYRFVNVTHVKHTKHTAQERKGFLSTTVSKHFPRISAPL